MSLIEHDIFGPGVGQGSSEGGNGGGSDGDRGTIEVNTSDNWGLATVTIEPGQGGEPGTVISVDRPGSDR